MSRDPHRFRLHRAGVLNVWQYDEQVFDFADGRLLLRGTNGAGKSKTLEMLLPFVLDGDKARMTATGRHGSQLLWLMTDGATGTGTRTGYLWVELVRTDLDGTDHTVTCGIGIRHSSTARTASTWQFTVPAGVPDLVEPDGTPLSKARCYEQVAELGGQSFDAPRAYKEHVGQLLFGLDPHAYDDLLRLLYWLRQPQIGEDLDPKRLVEMLDEALPALDEDAVRSVGEALDELAAHGERVQRMQAAAEAVTASATLYARYASTIVRDCAVAARAAERERAVRTRAVTAAGNALDLLETSLADAGIAQREATDRFNLARIRVQALDAGPLADHQRVLKEMQRRVEDLRVGAERSEKSRLRAVDAADSSRARVERGTSELALQGAQLAEGVAVVRDRLHQSGVDVGLAVVRGSVPQAEAVVAGVPDVAHHITTARAAVTVVRDALGVVEQRTRTRDAAADKAAEAERREEGAAGRWADAQREVAREHAAWLTAALAWAGDRVEVGEPAGLLEAARVAVVPAQQALRAREAEAAAARVAADSQIAELVLRRAQVLAERDPAPAAPPLGRSDRDAGSGLPLWRLVDIRDGVDAAPLEAALQASGLLDAQVLADGSWWVAEDTLLAAIPLDGPTLLDALSPLVPDGSPVPDHVVEDVLRSVQLLSSVEDPGSPAIGRDGSWRLGPLHGRATKPVAQFVGSVAREAERARRLAEVEEQVRLAEVERACVVEEEASATQELAALSSWLDAVPSSEALRRAWVHDELLQAEHQRAAVEARNEATRLNMATGELARAVAELQRLAAQHRLPVEAAALAARGAALDDLDSRLSAIVAEAGRLLTAARRLEEDEEAAERDGADQERATTEALAAADEAVLAAQESQALLETLGVDVQRMQAELAEARREQRLAGVARDALVQTVLELTDRRGAARAELAAADQRLAEALPQVRALTEAVAALREVPGLLDAGLGRGSDETERAGLDMLAGAQLPPEAIALLDGWAALVVPRPADANAVYADISALSVGPAADQEPRVVPVGQHLAVLVRDAAGAEQPLPAVAERLAAEVKRERELLTDRERTLFEEHLLGELGDALRARQAEAADLVRGMNDLLGGVKTSQGIRVRLDWSLRDDVGSQVREAVDLLGRPRGALSPDEQARLQDALNGLIEVQRAAEPERGYAEHLAQALDYRRWSAFTVRIHRPGVESWTTLTRRTPLSQGEQKVVCYLPLFAAAAAHFTSVAGAAPYAPRLILLDDAFPKIDVRTHPLLFGLLVDLDLDFVLTSERLWGDHATVPSLAVYEALRAPGERGIAQYRYTWDGHTLVGHG
jgi:uncharacterized protein (TIGR02680 family)